MKHINVPGVTDQLDRIVRAINNAKDGGDYYAANILFVAALHFITRNKRVLEKTLRHWCYVEVLPSESAVAFFDNFDDEPVGHYDLLNIDCEGRHTCIPMPMLSLDIAQTAYAVCRHVERVEHNRDINPSLPDVWSEELYGYMRTGEEALPDFLSKRGLAETAWLRGRRLGTDVVDFETQSE